MPSDESALLDIAKAARWIQRNITGVIQEAFLDDSEDDKIQRAILHAIMIIGEATKRLSMEYRNNHPQISWRAMAGMRDVLIHAYDTVDLEEVWKVATQYNEDLLAKLEPLLPTDEGDNST